MLQEGESMRAEAGPDADRAYYDPYEREPIGPYPGPPGPYAGSYQGPYAGPYYEPPPWASGW